MVAIIATQAANNVVSKIVVSDLAIPPIAYAATRSALVALCASAWLFPRPKDFWRVLLVALLVGGPNQALLFVGLQHTSPSVAAITFQLGMPFGAVLAMVFLQERVTARRWVGIVCTFVGAVTVMWKPGTFALAPGLIFIALAALFGAGGAVLIRRIPGVRPLQLQAWVGFAGVWPLGTLTVLTEQDQVQAMAAGGFVFLGCLLFSVLGVSILAHTLHYGLMQKHEASLMAPLAVMNPLFTMLFGVIFTGDIITFQVAAGAALAVLGIIIVTFRPPRRPLVAYLWPWSPKA